MTASTSSWPLLACSDEVQTKIKASKLLVVGAGGIGCELLKTLVLSGFCNIKVIDLDTIDTSNLNRQFLFRKKHVGQSKASVAAESVRSFCPEAKIEAFCDNVKDPQYSRDFFSQFDVVLNGLDNLEARRHVNRLCLAAEKPLVESGTAGYLGQVSVHIPQKYECFECQPKPVPKSFPVCTIRNTPEKPIHCIVWGKELLFQRLFGRVDQVTDLDEEGDAAGEEGDAAAEDEEKVDSSTFLRAEGESVADYAARIFERVFQLDIERVLRMDDLWKSRSKPTPLVLGDILGAPAAAGSAAKGGAAAESASKSLGLTNHHKVWTVEENAGVFLECIRIFHEERKEEVGAAVFDKDDPLAVDFVTAASNLRSLAYGIPPQTAFDAKGMAGNIIHAIATTNAIVSGLITAEAIKIVAGLPDLARTTFLLAHPTNGRVLQPTKCVQPNPKCPVCSKARLHLSINTKETTFGDFVNKVLKKQLSMIAPSVSTDGGLGYEEGDDLEEDERQDNARLLTKALADLPGGGITTDTVVEIDDFAQQFELKIIVSHQEEWDEKENPDRFVLKGEVPAATPGDEVTANGGGSNQAESSRKRALEDDEGQAAAEGGGNPGKRPKVHDDSAAAAAVDDDDDDDDIILVEEGAGAADDDDDVICLDD